MQGLPWTSDIYINRLICDSLKLLIIIIYKVYELTHYTPLLNLASNKCITIVCIYVPIAIIIISVCSLLNLFKQMTRMLIWFTVSFHKNKIQWVPPFSVRLNLNMDYSKPCMGELMNLRTCESSVSTGYTQSLLVQLMISRSMREIESWVGSVCE